MPTDATPTTTKVTGYRNPNDFPIQINLSSLGLTLTLPPKAYIMDRKGQKINDPALERLVRPGGLTRDEGKVEVPIISVQRQAAAENASQFSFAGTSHPKVDAHGRILEMPAKAAGGGSNQKNPVTGYSIEEARKLKLVNTPPDLPPAADAALEDRVEKPNPSMVLPDSVIARPTAQSAAPIEEIDLGGYTPPENLATVIAAKTAAVQPAPATPAVPPIQESVPAEAPAKAQAAPEPTRRKRRTKAQIAADAGKSPSTGKDEPKV